MNIIDWVECGGNFYPIFEPSIEEVFLQEIEEKEQNELNFSDYVFALVSDSCVEDEEIF